jgi:hypothetical protein
VPARGKGGDVMSQNEKELMSRRKLARHLRSKIRSEEYQRKRFMNSVYMWASLLLGIGVPLLFYGGIEYGFWHKPTTTSFELYSTISWLVVIWTFIRTNKQLDNFQKWEDQLLRLEMETPGLEEETETNISNPAA